MFNYYKTVTEIINEMPALNTYLLSAGNYYAHIPRNDNSKLPKENLEEHIHLVCNYSQKLTNTYQLDFVIDGLIKGLSNSLDVETRNYIKKLFVNTIVFHDFGKINERFQQIKMLNPIIKTSQADANYIGTTHSALGAFIYLTKHLNEIVIEKKQSPLLVSICVYFAYSIFKHHSRRLDDDCVSTLTFSELRATYNWEDVRGFLKGYLNHYQFEIHPNIFQLIGNERLLSDKPFTDYVNSFELYALCRLNFSLLTASDYLATNEYMNEMPIEQFGILTMERIEELYHHVSKNDWLNEREKKKNYNKSVFEKIDDYELQNPKVANGENLNVLRQEMAIEVLRNIRKHYKSNLFYIEAPTGGGKTNLSALAAIELLKIYQGQYNKIFYVFPFTTLITQTYKSLKETLGLRDDEMAELHSKAGMKGKNSAEDDDYGDDKLNYINFLFANFPFCLMTHIKFFDILKTNEKETNYLLHRLANSIVIIDELQSYNPEHWDKVIYFIRQYAKAFNIKFILMSATLPKLDRLDVIKDQVDEIVYLLPEAKNKYFRNPNFSRRVHFNFELLKKENIQLDEIADCLLMKSGLYAQKDFGEAKPMGSVYCIIEFIFKKTASEFYTIIKDKEQFFDEIFLLSGTILEHRRRYIINYLKNKGNRSKKILLITTQVVEAGVDIDMDLGFKDTSLIDSDEQLAGRINRNVNKADCQLFLFDYNKEAFIYGSDKRLKFSKPKYLPTDKREQILIDKDFDLLYDLVMDDKNEWNMKEMVQNFSDYEHYLKKLKFKSAHEKFKLIEQKNISCFVPLNIPIEVEGSTDGQKEAVFTPLEINFLREFEVFPNEDDEIEGEKVFDIYLSLIHNKHEFIKQKTYEKMLQGIMSKFVFSLFANDKVEQQIIHFSDEEKSEYGYKYLTRWNEFYDEKSGMRDADFNSNETQFL